MFLQRQKAFGRHLDLQVELLDWLWATKLESWTALGLKAELLGRLWASNLDVWERLGRPSWDPGSGPPSWRLWEALGSQVRLHRRVLGLLSQLEDVFGCTFAML